MIDVDLIISLMAALLSGETAGHLIVISELHFDFAIKGTAGPNHHRCKIRDALCPLFVL